jgi:hypothetical protein
MNRQSQLNETKLELLKLLHTKDPELLSEHDKELMLTLSHDPDVKRAKEEQNGCGHEGNPIEDHKELVPNQ